MSILARGTRVAMFSVAVAVGGAAVLRLADKASAVSGETAPTVEATAQEPEPAANQPRKNPRPAKSADADVTLTPEKPEYFIGENVLLRWRLRNAGDKPLTFSIGGDGRTPGARRAIRFKVEAFDAAGKPTPDPYPNPSNMGGMGGSPTLAAGEDHWDELQLLRYREIATPGKYTIRVYHDLGWDPGEFGFGSQRDSSDIPPAPLNAPIVSTSVRFVLPDAAQARRVVDAMLSLPDYASRSWGEKNGSPFADFELLRYPVYLPIVKELVEKGDKRGLEAIGTMAFPEATAALLELMKHKDSAIAAKAGDLLLARTTWVHDVGPSRRNYLFERSWTDELKKQASPLAWELLAKEDTEEIIRGARLIQSLGSKEDLPALIQVMDRAIVALKNDDVEQRAYLRPPNASDALTDASREFLRRGAQPPDNAATPGAAIVWLLALKADDNFRPAGWQETARGLIRHEIPFVRSVALQNLPLPLGDATVAAVAKAIGDDFPPVQGEACELAGKVKSPVLGPPLIEALKTTENDWVLRGAFSAAKECGIANDQRLEICVRRMAPGKAEWNMLLMGLLMDGAIQHNGHGGRTDDDWNVLLPGIQTAWLGFIEAHREELRAGDRFPAADPPLSKKMFPSTFQIHRDGHPPWPEPPAT